MSFKTIREILRLIYMVLLLVSFLPLIIFVKGCAPVPSISDFFYVYQDNSSIENHFYPSGWMGDVEAISVKENCDTDCYSGSTCIKIILDTVADVDSNKDNWAGIYWQHPPNNWGYEPFGGYNLTGCKELTFQARGESGEEMIRFFAGGIRGVFPDSFDQTFADDLGTSGEDDYISLTQDWKEYIIDLEGKDLSRVVGGFGCVASSTENPQGATFYLDEIKYYCPES